MASAIQNTADFTLPDILERNGAGRKRAGGLRANALSPLAQRAEAHLPLAEAGQRIDGGGGT
eukprot:7378327-Prymnesium_polylepis.1